MTGPTGIVVRADSPNRNVPDLIRRAKADPNGIAVSTSSIGTDDHLLMAPISRLADRRFTIVHDTGATLQRAALMSGQVQLNTLSIGEIMPQPQGPRFLAHGGTGDNQFAPGIPTFRSLALDFTMLSERGLVGTPAPIVERQRDAVQEAAADPATVRSFEALSSS